MPAPSVPEELSWKELLSKSAGLCFQHGLGLIWASLVLAGAFVVPQFLFGWAGDVLRSGLPGYHGCVGVAFSVAGWIAAMLLAGIPLAAMTIMLVEGETDVRAAFRRTRPHQARLMKVLLLYGFLVAGGVELLVLPGALMAVGFVFAPLLCLLDGVGGLDAFSGSREFFRWQARPVAARVLAGAAPLAVLSLTPGPWFFLVFLYMPFFVCWMTVLFQELKPGLGQRAFAWKSGASYFWLALAGHTLGAVLLLLAALSRSAPLTAPNSSLGAFSRAAGARMSGLNGNLNGSLSRDGKDALEETGRVLVGVLSAAEGKWRVRSSTATVAAVSNAGRADPTGVAVSPATPSGVGEKAARWREAWPALRRRAADIPLGKGLFPLARQKAKGLSRRIGEKLLKWGNS